MIGRLSTSYLAQLHQHIKALLQLPWYIVEQAVEILAIVPKSKAPAWLEEIGEKEWEKYHYLKSQLSLTFSIDRLLTFLLSVFYICLKETYNLCQYHEMKSGYGLITRFYKGGFLITFFIL